MELKINYASTHTWEDEIRFVRYTTSTNSSFKFSFATLSKRLLLLKFANSKNLNELQMFLLDNLSKLTSLIFYHETNELVLKLCNNVDLCISTDWNSLDKIINGCIIEQFKKGV